MTRDELLREFPLLDYCRRELGMRELASTVGMSGKLVTPQEAKAVYEREHEEIATAAVFVSASNYLANVTVTPEAVAQYYSNHVAEYRIPDRVQVTTGSGVEYAPRLHLTRLRALGQERVAFPILSHTLPPSAGIDGLLGLDFLRGQRLEIDFARGVIALA